MEHIQNSEELPVNAEKPSNESGSIKFFSIFATIGIGFGCAIALFDLMFHPILSALLGLIFIFIGSACAIVAAAKFLQVLDEKLSKHK